MARPKAFAEQDALHAAMETFWWKGYHLTSMQDLVEAMGINRASLYDTFTDKHTLYKQALHHYQNLTSADVADVLTRTDTARTRIQALFDQLVGEILDDADGRGCLMANATLEMIPHYPDVQAIVCADAVATAGTLRGLVSSGIESGEFRPDLPPDDVVAFLNSQMAGIRVVGKINPDAATLNAVVRLAMTVLA